MHFDKKHSDNKYSENQRPCAGQLEADQSVTGATIDQRINGVDTSDGAGVRLKRILGTHQLRHLDPFLLLDEFKSDQPDDYIGGFPDHPHRGFETVTYLLEGAMEHGDHLGNKGIMEPGSVQWMTAGRGVIHSEMPRQRNGLLWGFQLWINLPAKEKLCEPQYQEYSADQIPEVCDNNGVVRRVIAGHSLGVDGAVAGIGTDPLYVDIRLPANTRFEHPLSADSSTMIYLYQGGATIGDAAQSLNAGQLAVLSHASSVSIDSGSEGARLLLLAARPIKEPIVQYGPFVMNSEAEIQQALNDYQQGRLVG